MVRSISPHTKPRCARAFTLALGLAALTGCPGDDGTGETGSMATTAGGTATGDSSGETADSDSGGPSPAECSFDDDEWAFVDALDMPRMRGVGTEDRTCNPVTEDTIALDVQIVVPEGIALDPSGTVRVLLFEADPNVQDTVADCVGGLCDSLAGDDPLHWSFAVPSDRPELSYYIVVDVDPDGPAMDGCTLRETDFVTFAPAQGTLMVPMTADGCV